MRNESGITYETRGEERASNRVDDNHVLRSLSMYDKTLYLQRIFFAVEKTAKYEQDEIDGTARIIKGMLKDADKAIDVAIENLEEVLIFRKVFPRYDRL